MRKTVTLELGGVTINFVSVLGIPDDVAYAVAPQSDQPGEQRSLAERVVKIKLKTEDEPKSDFGILSRWRNEDGDA